MLPFSSQAQELITPPPAKFITRFPFVQYSGGVIIVRATFENIRDSFNFILDTGSGGISLDSSTCAQYHITTTPTDTTITGIGGMKKVNFVFNKSLHLPGVTTNHLNFHVNDYDILNTVYGEKIDGILGYSFFSRYIVSVNFDDMQIEIYSPGVYQYEGEGVVLHPTFIPIPSQGLQVKDRNRYFHNFYMDTGAGLCFLMSDKFASDSTVLLSKRRPKITQAEGMAGRLQMRLTMVREVKIGPYRFRRVPTYLYKDDYNVTGYPRSGGLIGNDLLRRFNIIFNYGQKEIHLKPNTHFNDLFDYSYTGLGIYYVDERISVEDVIPGSPADLSGFKVNDEIISVENNITYNIQAYKNLLQVPNQRIKVIIKRGPELMTMYLKTGSIL